MLMLMLVFSKMFFLGMASVMKWEKKAMNNSAKKTDEWKSICVIKVLTCYE